MSISQSNLSWCGYDFVIATTQESINAIMEEYLNSLDSPVVTLCYVADVNGNPLLIDHATLVANAKGTDPFNVPNGISNTSQELQNLAGASFLYAIQAQIGLPSGYAPLTQDGPALPNIVDLGINTASVTYRLMCSAFTVVELSHLPDNKLQWLNQSQADGNAWIFTSQVDLRLGIADSSAYGKLPSTVQNQIKNLGSDAFSVQQLLFDLDNAALQSTPTISGVVAGTLLYTCLQSVFLSAYLTELKKNGQPVLGYSILQSDTSDSSLTLTDMSMEVNLFMGTDGKAIINPTAQQQNLTTLCYLCVTNGNKLLSSKPFPWNWIETSEESNYQGIVAVNRNTFAKHLANQLLPYVKSICFSSPSPGNLTAGQMPSIEYPLSGDVVLIMSYDSKAQTSGMVSQKQESSTQVTVRLTGNTIIINQLVKVYLSLDPDIGSTCEGYLINKSICDTYTLSVNDKGGIIATMGTPNIVSSSGIDVGAITNFLTGFRDLIKIIEAKEASIVSASLQDISLSSIQNFCFPGGKTFTFETVAFSKNQDLVAHISYVQPS